jgi:hypothetical protein
MVKVTADPTEAARLAAGGTPVVLVRQDAAELGRFVASFTEKGPRRAGSDGGASSLGAGVGAPSGPAAGEPGGRAFGPPAAGVGAPSGPAAGEGKRCLVAVLVGDLADPEVAAAAEEMAAELWPWDGGPGRS